MNLSKLHISHISALQIFQLLRFSAMIAIGAIFARSGLSNSAIGQYETFLLIAGAVTFFWLNGIIQSFLPKIQKEDILQKTPALFNIFYLILGLSVLAGFFLLVLNRSFSNLLLNKTAVPWINYLIIYLVVSTPASLVEYIYLIKNQGKKITNYGFISFFLMILLVVSPPLAGYGIEYSLTGLIVAALIRFIWLLVLLLKNSSPVFDLKFIKSQLWSAAPLILSLLLSGSGQYIDSFIVTSYFDDASFAIFRFGAREFPLALLLANAFSTSMLTGFSDFSQLNFNLNKIRTNAETLGNWLFPLSGTLLMFSHLLFPIIFNESFSQSATIFNIYLLLIISRLLFPQTILIGLQKTKLILFASFFEIILNVASSLYFVRIFGLAGVAYGTVLAYLAEKILLMFLVSKTFRIKPSAYLNISRHLMYSVLLLIVFIIVEFLIW